MDVATMVTAVAGGVLAQAGGATTGATTGAAQAAKVGEVAAESVTLLDYIKDGGVVSYVLIGLSLTALTLIIRNALAFRRSRQAPEESAQRIETFLKNGGTAEAERYCSAPENDSMLCRIVASALARCNASAFGMMEFRAGSEEAGAAEVEKLHRMNDGVGIIAAVAPMLGLLGTVIGMIGAFRTIGTLSGSARSSQLATFMSMALVNTAEGLVVAIPCTIAFALFRRQIDSISGDAGRMLDRIATAAQRGAPAPGAAGGAGGVRKAAGAR